MTIYAPCRSYSGRTPVKVVGVTYDTRGQVVWQAEALSGYPWDDAGMFGWSSTNKRKFYPEQLEKVTYNKEQK